MDAPDGSPLPRRFRPVALGLLALVAAGPLRAQPAVDAAPPAAGTLLRSPDGDLIARFPAPPHFEEHRESTFLGTLRTQSWEVEDSHLRLRVERHDLPALALLVVGARGLLDRAERSLLADLGAKDVVSEPTLLRGHPGRVLRYEPGDRPGEREEARLYLVDGRIYVVFGRGSDPLARAEVERFLASVEIATPAVGLTPGAAGGGSR
jgi:hypothetical protein